MHQSRLLLLLCAINTLYELTDWGLTIGEDPIDNSFSTYYDGLGKTFKGNSGYYYDDSYFDKAARYYNQSLATMSLCLAFSTYGDGKNYKEYDKNVKKVLQDCGFAQNERYKSYHFNEKPTTGSIGCVIGSKEINGSDVVVVAVRSGGYEAEWSSNFAINSNGNHAGFDYSAEAVKAYVISYIQEKDLKGDIKIWITGYSRGAAVATQAAAKLDDLSGFGYSKNGENRRVDFDKDSIYAYGFATPAGVIKSSNPHDMKYNNIFNVIDYNDPVPLVAPEMWGFDRYGTTKILPFKESCDTEQFSKYINALRKKMKGAYKIDNFRNVDYFNNDSLGTYCRKMINKLAQAIVSRDNFASNYQAVVQDKIRKMNYEGIDFYDWIDIIYNATEKVVPNFVIRHGITTATLVKNNKLLADVHANQEYYLYGMQLMDSNYSGSLPLFWGRENYRVFRANCPVEIYVIDTENDDEVEVGGIYYDEYWKEYYVAGDISAGVDENGQKTVYLPVGEGFRIEVKAIEDCEFSCGFEEYNTESGTNSRVLNFETLTLKEGDEVEAVAEAFSATELENGANDGSEANYYLSKNNQNVDITGDFKGSENIENHTYEVSAFCDSDEGEIIGGGYFVEGSFAQISACNKAGYELEGFYINDEKVPYDGTESSKYTVRFQVNNDVTIEARYKKCNHDWDSGEITKEPTYTDTGIRTFTCKICGQTIETEEPKKMKPANSKAGASDDLEWNGTLNTKIPAVKGAKFKAAKKKVTVSWKKANKKNLKKFDKVEVQVCPNKAFKRTDTKRVEVKKKKKSVAVKKLKKGTYFVRVRDVKGAGTAKQVSKWSKVKKVKVK